MLTPSNEINGPIEVSEDVHTVHPLLAPPPAGLSEKFSGRAERPPDVLWGVEVYSGSLKRLLSKAGGVLFPRWKRGEAAAGRAVPVRAEGVSSCTIGR